MHILQRKTVHKPTNCREPLPSRFPFTCGLHSFGMTGDGGPADSERTGRCQKNRVWRCPGVHSRAALLTQSPHIQIRIPAQAPTLLLPGTL